MFTAPKPRKLRRLKFEYWKQYSQWRWHLKATNGEIVAQGEGYENEVDCLNVFSILCSVNVGSTDVKKTREQKKPKHFEGHLNRSWP